MSGQSIPAVFTSAGARFVNTNGRQLRQQRLQLIPDPFRQVFAGWILKARDVIQVVMIEAFIQRFKDRLDFRKVPDPAGMGINLSGQMNADTKRMPMQTSTLVSLWNVREAVC
ncbi:hypothetical protein IV03_05980 [Pseudomonas congelans]|nr:hypothetical protein IV03_05980 [Pseudomonas congelans]